MPPQKEAASESATHTKIKAALRRISRLEADEIAVCPKAGVGERRLLAGSRPGRRRPGARGAQTADRLLSAAYPTSAGVGDRADVDPEQPLVHAKRLARKPSFDLGRRKYQLAPITGVPRYIGSSRSALHDSHSPQRACWKLPLMGSGLPLFVKRSTKMSHPLGAMVSVIWPVSGSSEGSGIL